MATDVTDITVWKDSDSATYYLGNGNLNVSDRYAKFDIYRSRLECHDDIPNHVDDYHILASDDDGVVYEGQVSHCIPKHVNGVAMIAIKCKPATLFDG